MSRIPTVSSANKKPDLPSFSQRRPLQASKVSSLSNIERRDLLAAHTRPMRAPLRTTTTSSFNNGLNKRPAATSLRDVPNKQPKVAERKVAVVAPKIPPYDFKARFTHLLEQHKIMKSEYEELKEKHEEIADDLEKYKDSSLKMGSENEVLMEKLQKTVASLKEKTSEYEKMKIDCDLEKHENAELRRKTETLLEVADNLRKKSIEFDKLEGEFVELKRRHQAIKEEMEAVRVLNDHLKKISVDHERLQLEHAELKKLFETCKTQAEKSQNMLASMYKEQRDLRNTVQDLKGNIRVYCRVRPPLESESSKPLFAVNVTDACTIEVEKFALNSISQSNKKGKQQQSFTFDGIFTPHSTQEDVFAEVSPMIQSALDGYNVCIFAYGQTGSGKTYTMEGGSEPDKYGIIPRAFDMIFDYIEELKGMGWELSIKASFLEIYNENIYDLLKSSKEQEDHDIKMVDAKGTDVYVSNLREEEVKSSHDFIRYMMYAQRNRQTAATINNERSSRSHSVTQVKISAINEKRKEKFTSNLNLVDLAGSESGKTTQRMDETKHINRSLSELSKVILSLQSNQAHIPYRNSKLTYLLMPSLGGNSKTLMLVNVAQLDECFGETLNSLRFATKVNTCRTIKAKKNLTTV